MSHDQLSSTNDRFTRQRQIKGFDQELISGLQIGLIGAGAIGNEVLKNFLLMGVGAVDVYDVDTTEESNLTRSVFLRSSDVGLNKAQAVVSRAQELHPNTKLRAIPGDIFETLSLSKTLEYDFLFCAVDNFEARLRINEIARITDRPWINCAIDARNVVVEIYPATSTCLDRNLSTPNSSSQSSATHHACYACGLPDSSYERIAKRYSCGGLQRAAYLERTIPTTAITASIGAALGVAEAFKLVREIKRVQAKKFESQPAYALPLAPSLPSPLVAATRIFIDSDLPTAQRVALASNPECPVCSERGSVPFNLEPTQTDSLSHATKHVIAKALSPENEANDLLNWLNELALKSAASEQEPIIFSDAVITKAQCIHCGPSNTLNALLGSRAKSVSDSVMVCQQCQGETVQLEFLEMCSISDLINQTITLGPRQPAWLCWGQHYFDRIPYFKDHHE
jgi:molybdopterin-synthase adenylyltransferase